MNVFTTDHPMVSQTSFVDRKAHPVLSFVCMVSVLAFVLFPALFWWVLYETRDLLEETGEELTLDEALICAGLIFAFCCLCSAVIVSLHRLVVRPGIDLPPE